MIRFQPVNRPTGCVDPIHSMRGALAEMALMVRWARLRPGPVLKTSNPARFGWRFELVIEVYEMKQIRRSCSALVLLGAAQGWVSLQAAELTISCRAVGQELTLCKTATAAWAARTGNQVKVVSTPNSTTERLALYQQLLAAGAGDIDVFQIDVIWPGLLANHLIDLNPYLGDAPSKHFQAIVDNIMPGLDESE